MDQYIEFASNHWMLVVAFLAVTFFLIQDIIESSMRKYQSISPILTVTKINSGSPVIVDVRDASDYNKGHIGDSINIPLGTIEKNISKIDLHKQDDVIVVCQSGMRSASACGTLSKLDFENVYSMIGGMQSWEENKLPVVAGKK